MTTIAEQYGLRLVTGYNSKHGEAQMPSPDQLVGIELEIEEWSPEVKRAFGGFSFTDDGSLRGSDTGVGIEAITLPVALKHTPNLLTAFFKHFGMSGRNYSERCSTHVHVNVQPFTFEQLTTICLVYQTAERLLFGFVGHDRDQSIFCVPWSQSNMSCSAVEKLALAKEDNTVFRAWQKYSALNLIPVMDKGTIEFRHMPGTCDVKFLSTWLGILGKLVEYSTQVEFEKAKAHIVNMNTVSNYHQWMDMVFGQYADALRTTNFEELLSIGVIDSKLMLTTAPKDERNWINNILVGANNTATFARAGTFRYEAPRNWGNTVQANTIQVDFQNNQIEDPDEDIEPTWTPPPRTVIPRVRTTVNIGAQPAVPVGAVEQLRQANARRGAELLRAAEARLRGDRF